MSATDTAMVVRQEVEKGLATLRQQAEAIVVTNQQDYIEAVQIKNAVNSYIKDVKAKLGPGIASAKDHLDFLKNEMAKYITPAEQIAQTVESKRIRWAEEEKRKAEAEERRINEERRIEAERVAAEERKERERVAAEERAERERVAEEERKERLRAAEAAKRAGDIGKREADRLKKEAEAEAERERQRAAEAEKREKARAAEDAKKAAENVQTVTVKPAVPVVAGAKNQTFYFAEVTDPQAIIRAYETAKDPVRIAFLRRFIQVNEQEVGKFARDTKDPKKCAELLPGVKFTSKG